MVLLKKYGTMDKTMILYRELWYFTENYGTSIYEVKKKHGRLPKTDKLLMYNGKHYVPK